ncbi:MAG: alpha/beta hydrolase [Alphaproteobacteria bacterium]|nr:alpha/beta hydrolase [Alphaproteobacteria bacterium]
MSAEELNVINGMLRQMRSQLAGTPEGGWPERRKNMEAGIGAFPADPSIELKGVDANGVKAEWQWRADAPSDAALMYVHGGGYAIGSIATHRPMTTAIAKGLAGRVLSLDYRLAPEHPCPAAIDDAVAGYRFLLDQGIKPARIAIAGDSAGGGLTVATLQAIRDTGLPAPAGGWCLSPWTDMTATSGTMTAKAEEDLMLSAESIREFAAAYIGSDALNPKATVLNASLKGLPPLFIQVGTAEVLLGDSLALAAKAAEANVTVTLETWPNMPHVFQMFGAMLSEGRDAVAHGVAWCNARIG